MKLGVSTKEQYFVYFDGVFMEDFTQHLTLLSIHIFVVADEARWNRKKYSSFNKSFLLRSEYRNCYILIIIPEQEHNIFHSL